ncbi:hypothetical protein ETH_00006325, partial [Eimeria tenella]
SPKPGIPLRSAPLRAAPSQCLRMTTRTTWGPSRPPRPLLRGAPRGPRGAPREAVGARVRAPQQQQQRRRRRGAPGGSCSSSAATGTQRSKGPLLLLLLRSLLCLCLGGPCTPPAPKTSKSTCRPP